MTKQPTLTKADLIEEVLKVTELPRKESEIIVETIFDSIIEAIQKGEKIEIRGFGSFRTRERRGRVHAPRLVRPREVDAEALGLGDVRRGLFPVLVAFQAQADGDAHQKAPATLASCPA